MIIFLLITIILVSCIIIYRYKNKLKNIRTENNKEINIGSEQIDDIYDNINEEDQHYSRINYNELNAIELYDDTTQAPAYAQITSPNAFNPKEYYFHMKSINDGSVPSDTHEDMNEGDHYYSRINYNALDAMRQAPVYTEILSPSDPNDPNFKDPLRG